jgi:succinyl-diaminopimelate desuccinylase
LWTSEALSSWIRKRLDAAGGRFDLEITVSGESFLTPPGPVSTILAQAIERVTSRRPEFSTTGGTSDARFIKDFCKVAEFGLVGETMHKVDERASTADIERLTETYRRILDAWFEAPC